MASDHLDQVLHMKQGTGKTSYARASYVQKQTLLLTKSMKQDAIKEFYLKQRPRTLCIADLGCSSAKENNLCVITELIEAVEEVRREFGYGPKEYSIYLNDLPGNDFNTLFRSLTSFEDSLKQQMGDGFKHCFINAVPRSFYGRLFPNNTLHFVHSSSSLQWLSQLPEGIEGNKGNIYIGPTSPPDVIKAYSVQYQKDFTTFLRCRSKEVVAGGRMELTIIGRKSGKPYSKDCCHAWELLATVLNDMVLEGFIEEYKLDTFNIPIYYPSQSELRFLVEREGSFNLNSIHAFEVSWNPNDYEKNTNDHYEKNNDVSQVSMYDFVKCMRSVAEPLLIEHFGEVIIDEMFTRYWEIIRASTTKEKNAFINVTVSLTRNE